MTQERMHPEDRRALMAASLLCSLPTYSDLSVSNALEATDRLLAELARTAKPEAEILPLAHVFKSNDGTVIAKLYGNASIVDRAESAEERADKAEATLRRLGYPEDGRKCMWEHVLNRAELAEARVKELEDAIKRHRERWGGCVYHFEENHELWLKVK